MNYQRCPLQLEEPVQINLPNDPYWHKRIAWVNRIFLTDKGFVLSLYNQRGNLPRLFIVSELTSLKALREQHLQKSA